MSRPRVLIRLAGALSVTLAMAAGMMATAMPAHAQELGTVMFMDGDGNAQTSGDVHASPMAASATTSEPCPSDFGNNAAIRARPAGAVEDGNSFGILLSAGGYDSEPPVFEGPSLQLSLAAAVSGQRNDPPDPAPGDYQVYVVCSGETTGSHPEVFATIVTVTGTTWEVREDVDDPTDTTTTLAVEPADSTTQGDDVLLAATVSPDAAAGSVEFLANNSPLGTDDVTEGTSELTTDTLPVGTHSLTAVFTPADPAAFTESTSAEVMYEVKEPVADPNLVVRDADGNELGNNPALTQGQVVTLDASGFDGDEEITVSLDAAEFDTATAVEGVVNYEFTVPEEATEQAHALELAGAEHEVTFAFTVAAGSNDDNDEGEGGGGTLPTTGTSAGLLAGAGIVLVGGGAGAMLVARRRRGGIVPNPGTEA